MSKSLYLEGIPSLCKGKIKPADFPRKREIGKHTGEPRGVGLSPQAPPRADFTIFSVSLQHVTCLLSQRDMSVPALASLESEPVFGTQQTPGSLSLHIKSTLGFQSFVRTGSSSHLSEKESLDLGYGLCHQKSSLIRIFLYILEYSCLRLLGQILALSKAHSTLTTTTESTKYLILLEKRKQHCTIQLHAKLGKKNLTKTEGMLLYSKVKKQNRTQTTSSDDIMENTFQLSLRSIMTSSCALAKQGIHSTKQRRKKTCGSQFILFRVLHKRGLIPWSLGSLVLGMLR